MKKRLIIVMIFLVLVISPMGNSEEKKGYYFDVNDKPLVQYNFLHDELIKYFGNSVPDKIIVVYKAGILSQFRYKNQSVLINDRYSGNKLVELVGHESCHLSMGNYTKGVSLKEKFRFFDEGFAFIFENMLAHKADEYKHASLAVASLQNLKNNITFTRVQKWYDYFFIDNSYKSVNQYSYKVGSSFVYFVLDTYGMDSFLAFCKNIGETEDLDKTCRNIFKKSQMIIESEWQQYINKVDVPTTQPHIVKMFPENKTTQVSIKINEIYVEFDIPMDTFISVGSDSQGISFENAYWKTDKILAIKVNLLPDHIYNITLGHSLGNKLLSKDSVELPTTLWSFKTGSK